ncbi:glycosyltransferase family 2 protein [Thiocapsa marina]|uniref:Glycosyl transferase family 2 n=1 Tax=Thiocapsa marina 5811 TaxID=768671 RepID=F9U6Y6_9GAMM|nr:glycosyltransferase family 2 protein [Thiocapsa marina]EGV20012.1 glycosyl transferase family 2 [Thiocapsa marina 5811]
MKRKALTLVTPVYNEQEVIERFYLRTREVLRALEGRYRTRMLFVVDRCTDDTLAILRRVATDDPDAQVLALSARFGHQMSLLAGIDAARDADVIIMMDSDLQHPPSLIPALLERYELGDEIVHTIRKDTEGGHLIRRVLGNLFYHTLSIVSRTNITANAADFRLISGRVAKILRHQIRERNLFLRGIFAWIGFQQGSVNYVAAKREGGRTKYSFGRMLNLAAAGILSFSTKPLQLSIIVGISLAVFGFLIGIYAVWEYFVSSDLPSGWTTLVTLLVFFSGIQLIFMGIIGIYIGGIYEEVKGRPHYIVEQRINI